MMAWFANVALSLSIEELTRSFAVVVLTALWQSAALGFGLVLCLRCMSRTTAAQRFALWGAAFVAMLVLPVLPLIERIGFSADVAAAHFNLASAQKHWLVLDARWSVVIAALWLLMVLVRMAYLFLHVRQLRRLAREARPAPGIAAVEIDGRGKVTLYTSSLVERPCVIGFWRPRILVPDWLLPQLTAAELRQVMMHECEHLRRRDDWTNLVQKLALALFPLNPALSVAEKKLCREREMACDEAVVRQTRAPRAYAACLASLAERGLHARLLRRAEALALGVWQHRSELVDRIESLLCGRSAMAPAGRLAMASMFGCILLASMAVMARCSQWIGFSEPARASVPVTMAALQRTPSLSAIQPQVAAKVAHPRVTSVPRAKTIEASETLPVADVVRSKTQPDTHVVMAHAAEHESASQWVVLTVWPQNTVAVTSSLEEATPQQRMAWLVQILEMQAREREAQARADWLIFEL